MAAPFLSESSCIAALAAQLFRGFSVAKAFANRLCSSFCKDFIHVFREKITQCNVTFMIQAAGDDRTVTENTDLISQAIAEDPIASILRGKIRPVEFVTVFQKDPVADGSAFPTLNPGLGEETFHF